MPGEIDVFLRHIELFNVGVRDGDFGPMVEQFDERAELSFEGVPVGPFIGRAAIAAAYEERPPDDEVVVLGAPAIVDGVVVAPYAWQADAGTRAGEMRLTVLDGRVQRLVVSFS